MTQQVRMVKTDNITLESFFRGIQLDATFMPFYNPAFNWLWLNNGYHAEHHYRPKHHWTKMHELHLQIADKQVEAGVKVIAWPQQFGFLAK